MIPDLLGRWRDELIRLTGASQVAVSLYRWQATALAVWPARSWWPWGLQGGLRHPGSGWLVPVHSVGAESDPALLAPRRGAGEGLPGLLWDGPRRAGEALERRLQPGDDRFHAEQSGLPEALVRRRRTRVGWLPQAQYGFVVEVRGRAWGVVMAESPDPAFRATAPVRTSAARVAQELDRALAEDP